MPPEVFAHGPRCCLDVVDDGFEVGTERRSDGHDDEVVVGDDSEIGCGAAFPDSYVVGHQFVEPWLRHGGLAQVDLVDDGLSERRSRLPASRDQPSPAPIHRADIAEADNCDKPGPHVPG